MTPQERKELLAQMSRARKLPGDHLQCRSLGHAWRQVKPDSVVEHGETLAYQCASCLTIRTDIISPKYGELLARSYRHVPGYIHTRPDDGSRLFSASALRAERARRRREGQLDEAELKPITTTE